MGFICNKIAASGKMSATEMNQLMDSGIPILQLLSDTMGVSTEEVKKFVSGGKVGMPKFQAAIEKGMGGAALSVGQTFTGSVDNAKAAFSRLGAGIISPFTEALTPALAIITGLVDDIAEGTTDNISGKVSELSGIIKSALTGLLESIKPILEDAITVISKLIPAISEMLSELIPIAMDIINMLIINITETDTINNVGTIFSLPKLR